MAAAVSIVVFTIETAQVRSAEIGCPRSLNGKPLEKVGLFDGSPANHADLMPENGGYYYLDDPQSRVSSYFALGCNYRNSKEKITVVLPPTVRTCRFLRRAPQLACH